MDRREAADADREAVLVGRARGGDARAFEELVRSHLDRVWRVVWRILRHREDTEDVVQEVFMAAHRGLSGFQAGSRFATWLHRIAVNRALNHRDLAAERLRRASVSIEPDTGERVAFLPREAAGGDPGPLAAVEERELARRLKDCLEKLSPASRAVLALRINEGLDYSEIAAALETAIGTVRSRLARARLALRECLGGERA